MKKGGDRILAGFGLLSGSNESGCYADQYGHQVDSATNDQRYSSCKCLSGLEWRSDVEQEEIANTVGNSADDESPEVVYYNREAFREGAVFCESCRDEVDSADEKIPRNDKDYPSSDALAGYVDHIVPYA